MDNINRLLDSTYLKDDKTIAIKTIEDAIKYDFKLVMIKPDMVSTAKKLINDAASGVLVGTVIDFPKGDGKMETKLSEAQEAVDNGADELDYVSDYNAFKTGNITEFVKEILECTKFGLKKGKVVKWIIETGALDTKEIAEITETIRDVVQFEFPSLAKYVFIKTSTGFYRGTGATPEDVAIMRENSGKLPIKASGGVSNMEDAINIIKAGATRIGTSKAVNIVTGEDSGESGY